jgi:hypothetical protein
MPLITERINITKVEFFFLAKFNSGNCTRDFARAKSLTPDWALMVK